MAILVLEKRCKKCGGMICVNLVDFKQKVTYANKQDENYKEGLCFECATGINLDNFKSGERK